MHKLQFRYVGLQESGKLVPVIKKYPFATVQVPDDASKLYPNEVSQVMQFVELIGVEQVMHPSCLQAIQLPPLMV